MECFPRNFVSLNHKEEAMTIRDMIPFGRTSVPVNPGRSPIGALQTEMNRLFEDFFGPSGFPALWDRAPVALRSAFDFTPAVDVRETDKTYQIIADIPGIDAKDVSVTVADGCVTVKGEKKCECKEEKEGYVRQERSYGSFQRVIGMPDTANLDQAEASIKDGVLIVDIPKKAESQSKQRNVEIKHAA